MSDSISISDWHIFMDSNKQMNKKNNTKSNKQSKNLENLNNSTIIRRLLWMPIEWLKATGFRKKKRWKEKFNLESKLNAEFRSFLMKSNKKLILSLDLVDENQFTKKFKKTRYSNPSLWFRKISISFPSFPELPGEECERLLISGSLPPQQNVQGEGDSGEAIIFRDFDKITFGEFLLDSMVCAKRRLSTYKCTKKMDKGRGWMTKKCSQSLQAQLAANCKQIRISKRL